MTTTTPILVLNPGQDSGISSSDGTTDVRTIRLSGTATPGNRVLVFNDVNQDGVADFPDQTLGGVIAETDGTWSMALTLADGSYQLTAIADDGTTQSALSTQVPLTIDSTAPTLTSVTLDDPSTTNAGVVRYTVTFSEAVTKPHLSDFALVSSGGLQGASIQSVTPVSGSQEKSFTVAVSTGTGSGSLALNVLGTSVTDTAGNDFAGIFRMLGSYATGLNPASVSVADLNHDGKSDVVVSNLYSSPLNADQTFGPGYVSVFLGNGDATFQTATNVPTGAGPYVTGIADLNGDGNLDLIELNAFQGLVNYQGASNGNVSVLYGDGTGNFTPGGTYDVGVAPEAAMVASDLNHDGHADLVVANTDANTISVLLGNADGTFQPQFTYAAGASPNYVAIGDLDNDGNADIVTANVFGNTISILPGNGNGTFQERHTIVVGHAPNSVAIGDLNGDGNVDIAVANYEDSDVEVLLGNGDGTFRNGVTYAAGQKAYVVETADVNGDGRLDLLVSNAGSGDISILLGNGDGTFQPETAAPTGGFPSLFALEDLNGDGRPDLVVPNYNDGTISVLLNDSGANVSPAYTIDKMAVRPTGLTLAPASDTGVAIDAITADNTPTIIGHGYAGDAITLYDTDGTAIGSAVAASDGAWSITPAQLADGVHSLRAKSVDGAGNVSVGSVPLTVTIDDIDPTVAGVTPSLADGIIGPGTLVSFRVSFDEPVFVDTTTGGAPTLVLNNGGVATYTSGSGTGQLNFSYTVGTGQEVAALSISGASLNGANVTDAAGNPADFSAAAASLPGTLSVEQFGVFNMTTLQAEYPVAQHYSGPVAGLQGEYIDITSDKINVSADSPNWFIHTGSGDDAIAVSSGTNVLDGGTGSNFLVGGSGTDTFFVDNRGAQADIWSTVVNFHAGDAVTVWGVTPQDFQFSFANGEGAAGYTGLTLHATSAGKPTASVTFAGFTATDLASGRILETSGTEPVSGSSYTYFHCN